MPNVIWFKYLCCIEIIHYSFLFINTKLCRAETFSGILTYSQKQKLVIIKLNNLKLITNWFNLGSIFPKRVSSVIRQNSESQNGCFKKAKHVRGGRGKKCSFSGKFGVLCFLETPFWDSRFCLITVGIFRPKQKKNEHHMKFCTFELDPKFHHKEQFWFFGPQFSKKKDPSSTKLKNWNRERIQNLQISSGSNF